MTSVVFSWNRRENKNLPIRCLVGERDYNIFPKQRRLLAVGDLHGDMQALRAAFEDAAGVSETDPKTGQVKWIGDDAVMVVIGDLIDRMRPGLTTLSSKTDQRGEGEYAFEEYDMLMYINTLDSQARKQRGRVIKLLGNHELGSLWDLDDRFVTPFALQTYGGIVKRAEKLKAALQTCNVHVLAQVGSWCFVHGGLNREIVDNIPSNGNFYKHAASLNMSSSLLQDENGLLWNREASQGPVKCDRVVGALDRLLPHLHSLGYSEVEKIRLAVAHTNQYLQSSGYVPRDVIEMNDKVIVLGGKPEKVQTNGGSGGFELGINFKCNDRVACLDTGMSRAFDDKKELLGMTPRELKARLWARRPQVLEILDDQTIQVRVARRSLPRSYLTTEEITSDDLVSFGYKLFSS